MRRVTSLRGRLTTVALVGTLLAIAASTFTFNLLLRHSLDADANRALRTQAAAARTTVAFENGRMVIHDSSDDAAIDHRVWIFEGRRAVDRPAADGPLQRAANRVAGRATGYTDIASPHVRLYVSPITDSGRRVGSVVTAESLGPYNRTRNVALLSSLGLGAVLLALVFALMRIVIGRALGPVREMTRSAATWSEQEPARRFGFVPRPDELGELASTFDALLDRVAASLRHEQRLSAELSHELRTPLARIAGEVELLQRRERSAAEQEEALAIVARSAHQMQGILDTLMAAARAEAGLDTGRCDVVPVLNRLADGYAADGEKVRMAVLSPPSLIAAVDSVVLERAVTPMLENALRFAAERVSITATPEDGAVKVVIADDGPGIAYADLERVFQPGVSLDAANGHGGAGLGLALARRLLRAAGGDVRALEVPAGGAGAAFSLTLPT